ncbi:glycosyltransferase [Candidatus Dojkabacteria bacterium]|nr:glycosyltransferase [Candidatus Dojkabacteria bacterium]
MKKTKICYVLSHSRPNYIRTQVLVDAMKLLDDYELVEARNKSKSIFRYIETILKLIWIRITENPDIYFLGFRAQDIYFPVRILTLGKPLIVDEFVVAYDSIIFEGKFERLGLRFRENGIVAKILYFYEKLMLKTADFLITDTHLHKQLITELFPVEAGKIQAVPVGTNERYFNKENAAEITERNKKDPFKVFYYGDIMKLHGFDILLKAIKILNERDLSIEYKLGIGNKQKYVAKMEETVFGDETPDNVSIIGWIDGYDRIIDHMNTANLCVSGPLGATNQARRVIHGKTYQYLALGRPTVIGKIPYDYGFINKKNCLYVEQGDPEALAELISWSYKHPHRLKKIGRNARLLYEERFSNKVISEILAKVLESAVNE